MKKNRSSLILTLVLVVVSVYFLFFRNGFSTISEKDNDFAVQDTASITKIFMADKRNSTVTLTKVRPGVWRVNDHYEVRSDAINNLLITIKMVSVKSIIDPRGATNVIKDLATQAMKVEIYSGDKRIKMYYVGGPTADQLGTFMLLANHRNGENYSQPYIMYIPGFDGYLSSRYFIPEVDWRDRTVFRYYPYQMKSVKVVYAGADSGFQVNILGRNHFSMENPITHQHLAVFDTIAAKQYLTYYQNVSWEVTVSSEKRDSILHTPPIAVITVQDTAGKTTEIKLYNKKAPAKDEIKYGREYVNDPDRMLALINCKDFVIVQYYVFGKMLQNAAYFSRGMR
ncbi:MAG TPA: hypothetical protein VNZ45_03795 [Bacteroidia bacterium]|jgi:hypothetical protein|nr:hypothetical protein [Bacteroidia bacterium]